MSTSDCGKRVWNYKKHRGETLDFIVKEDPGYLRWMLENVTIKDNSLVEDITEVLLRNGENND